MQSSNTEYNKKLEEIHTEFEGGHDDNKHKNCILPAQYLDSSNDFCNCVISTLNFFVIVSTVEAWN